MRLETSITHQKEKFNKKLELLGRLFLGKRIDFLEFEDEGNIIKLRTGFFHTEEGFFLKPNYWIEKK